VEAQAVLPEQARWLALLRGRRPRKLAPALFLAAPLRDESPVFFRAVCAVLASALEQVPVRQLIAPLEPESPAPSAAALQP
jgi:hypothetical protein